MRTFFGHQSVGADLLAGIDDLSRRAGQSQARVVGLEQAAAATHPLLIIHERLGVNREPLTKIAAFRGLLNSARRPHFDVALLKFCYVDIATQEEAQLLLGRYEAAIEQLSAVHPATRLVHCTVPLRILPGGPYAWLRRAVKPRHPGFEANRARDWFNERLRQRYSADGLLFDLAAIESRHADGKRCERSHRGARAPSLAPEWTYDGGHLNERGRTMAAAAFLEFLQALRSPRTC
jgi:hypothetical protein